MVVEHEADDKVSRTHVHIWMYRSKYKTAEQYKRQFRKELPQFNDMNGNSLWSWSITRHYKEPDCSIIGYMLVRGDEPPFTLLDPKFNKAYTSEEIATHVRNRIDFLLKHSGTIRTAGAPSGSARGADKTREKKPRTDWEILDDMIKDLESRPHTTHLKQVAEGLINVPVWSRQEIQKVISKHLDDNKKKAAIHELQRWVATLMRRLEGHYDQLWESVWHRFDTKSRE